MHKILFILAVLLSVPSYAQQCMRGDKGLLLSLPSLQYVSLEEMRASFSMQLRIGNPYDLLIES